MLARRLPGAEDCLAGHARCTECNMCCAAARCLQLLSASAALRLPTAIVTKSGSCRSAAFRKSAACCVNVLYLSHALTPCRFSGEFSIFQDESKAGGPSFPSAGPRAAVSAPASVLAMLHVLRCGNANSGTRLQLRRTCARKTCRYRMHRFTPGALANPSVACRLLPCGTRFACRKLVGRSALLRLALCLTCTKTKTRARRLRCAQRTRKSRCAS